EDIALMRVIPNMVIVSPCDYEEAKKATMAVAKNGKPTYLRLARQDSPVLTKPEGKFEIGKANVLRDDKNPQVAIIGTGPILSEVLEAARELEGNGIGAVVINLHTIKPIDEQTLVHWAKIAGAVVTVEEHQTMGGMGSAVAEVLARNFPVPIEFIGVKDSFGESARNYDELWNKFGLKKENIIEAVKKIITRKNV
ncbi:MAG: transketolase family protein, partial [Candidatus Woesebacteria bacterium]|nr:transketolase family protein [Candidatus Woesebacteria bacterium]